MQNSKSSRDLDLGDRALANDRCPVPPFGEQVPRRAGLPFLLPALTVPAPAATRQAGTCPPSSPSLHTVAVAARGTFHALLVPEPNCMPRSVTSCQAASNEISLDVIQFIFFSPSTPNNGSTTVLFLSYKKKWGKKLQLPVPYCDFQLIGQLAEMAKRE